ncbi:MAG: hypothetical protein K2N24_01650 [Lachnospiraceae bacterium]|nr:hypothetical protein [Lachnospiraceae bacterium]
MTEQNSQELTRRKRINRMKKGLILLAVGLILASVTLNIILLIRVIQLNQLIHQLYGCITLIPIF